MRLGGFGSLTLNVGESTDTRFEYEIQVGDAVEKHQWKICPLIVYEDSYVITNLSPGMLFPPHDEDEESLEQELAVLGYLGSKEELADVPLARLVRAISKVMRETWVRSDDHDEDDGWMVDLDMWMHNSGDQLPVGVAALNLHVPFKVRDPIKFTEAFVRKINKALQELS